MLQRKIDTYINDNEQAILKKKNSQEHNVMKKVSSFTLPAVVVGLSVARKRKKSKWITDFEVTKFSTIILAVDRFLLLLMANLKVDIIE